MQQLRGKGYYYSIWCKTNIKKKAQNTYSALQDTFFSTKDIFERHRVVFTVSTSIASLATAWAVKKLKIAGSVQLGIFWLILAGITEYPSFKSGMTDKFNKAGSYYNLFEQNYGFAGYTLRRHHESKVENRLDSIEKAMTNNYHIEYKEFKELVGSGSSTTAATIATAGTTMVIGYVLGWRGGIWYANRKFRREQMKLLGQIKPKRWQRLQQRFFRRPLVRPKLRESIAKSLGVLKMDVSTAHNSLNSGIADTKV